MRVPTWGVYMMCIASIIGSFLLFKELQARHFPSPLSK